MNYPEGKTPAQLTGNVCQSNLKMNDIGYIDGYVYGSDLRPYIVFIREGDGLIDLVPIYSVKALFDS